MVNHRTHEEAVTCEEQVKRKIKLTEFTTIALGCLITAPFVPAIATAGLLGVGVYHLVKGAKESVYADNTHKLFMALHKEKDITSPEYKELSKISKEFANIEKLSMDKIHEYGDRIDELSESKNYRSYGEFIALKREVKHRTGTLKFVTLGIGCLMAAPFAGPLLTMGLVGAGIMALGKGAEKTYYAESTNDLALAMHQQNDINSPAYKELSDIANDFKHIDKLSLGEIKDRNSRIKSINEKVAKIRDDSQEQKTSLRSFVRKSLT